jgi:hypothetical protein
MTCNQNNNQHTIEGLEIYLLPCINPSKYEEDDVLERLVFKREHLKLVYPQDTNKHPS